ncbi:MAG: HAMP domain-containing histidine kinase [Rhodospirillaceae bacterium]|nr:HAMP domain-containing histidine kinase [Rhodospirillaceae bacterium]MBT3884239.1 HAMP domain-containing histidine kinase [Rhodospirillaceae bacterium]MBT4118814.1 HAMP domain-containing histidine kinase [Rhodospirillaceae bacterium]MBT4671651.1 HAMP domain-containing histidine kinase [Rhodospirillaceae bacterium]MBT4718513.1 HAMP domain-containing histidine kinase [Rhodospirillaceae bacterium]
MAGKELVREVGPPVIDGEFYAHARHDVRSPLTAILGFSESMSEAIFGPLGHEKYTEYVTAIHQSGQGLEHILTAIMAILSLNADAIILSDDTIKAEQVLQELESSWSDRASDWGVALTFKLDTDSRALTADKRRLVQALDCILENALNYTDAGGRVTVSSGENGGGGLVFVVEDTGPGMTGPDLDIALAPFGRVPDAPAHGRPGAGLGINLAAGIMALHQGALSITCALGQGTKVELTLPKARLNL